MVMGAFGERLVIPPLVEELSKLLALTFSFHFAIVYTLVFAIMEFIHYIIMFDSVDNEFLLIRFFCMVSHFIYLGIQIIGFKLYYKTDWKGYVIISFLSAWVLHVLWNGILGMLILLLIQTFL